MNPIGVGTVVLLCTFGGALAGMWVRSILPKTHLDDASRSTVTLGIGLIATMTALVLGLVTASVKSSFDALDLAVKHAAVQVLTLDRVLARYGPETGEIRAALKDSIGRRIDQIWPPESSRRAEPEPSGLLVRGAEGIVGRIDNLSPQNDTQRWLRSRALILSEAALEVRWAGVGGSEAVPVVFLSVLLFWLTVTFTSFGLFAPRNATVIATLFVCAFSVASAVFLILEMDGPFDGIIKVSGDPLRFAHSRVNQ